MRRFLAAVAVVAAAVAAPSAQAGPVIDRVVSSLQNDPVYVDPAARSVEPGAAERNLEQQIASGGDEAIYVAVLPQSAANEEGGSADAVLSAIANGVHPGRPDAAA